jgi:hypothetical protein
MGRPCSICSRSDRPAIDQALLAGETGQRVAERFRVGLGAVYRHRETHLPRPIVTAAEAHAREIASGATLLDQLHALNQRALALLDQAEAAGDVRAATAVHRELRGYLELLGKATGQMVERRAHLHAHVAVEPGAGARAAMPDWFHAAMRKLTHRALIGAGPPPELAAWLGEPRVIEAHAYPATDEPTELDGRER